MSKPPKPGATSPWRKAIIPERLRRVNRKAQEAARAIARMRNG